MSGGSSSGCYGNEALHCLPRTKGAFLALFGSQGGVGCSCSGAEAGRMLQSVLSLKPCGQPEGCEHRRLSEASVVPAILPLTLSHGRHLGGIFYLEPGVPFF